MDEAERDHGPGQPVPEHGEPRPEEPEPEWPVPALLQELAVTDVGEEPEHSPEEEPVDEDDGAAPGPRVRTSTKVVLVAAAWLLLTLFLVGRFSGSPSPEGSTRLDQSATDQEDQEAEGGEEAGAEADAEDAPAGEALAGDYADGAAIYGDGSNGGGAGGVAGGGSGVYAGLPADGSAGVGGGGAAPGAAPGAPGTTTSPTPAPGSGGGAATTTPPAGGGTTDTTAAPGGGSGGTTTTTAGAPPPDAPAPAATVRISWNGNKFVYDRPTISVPSGSVVRMVNDTAESHTWKMATWNVSIPPAGYVDRTITATGQFGCDTHRYMTGRITVT